MGEARRPSTVSSGEAEEDLRRDLDLSKELSVIACNLGTFVRTVSTLLSTGIVEALFCEGRLTHMPIFNDYHKPSYRLSENTGITMTSTRQTRRYRGGLGQLEELISSKQYCSVCITNRSAQSTTSFSFSRPPSFRAL